MVEKINVERLKHNVMLQDIDAATQLIRFAERTNDQALFEWTRANFKNYLALPFTSWEEVEMLEFLDIAGSL